MELIVPKNELWLPLKFDNPIKFELYRGGKLIDVDYLKNGVVTVGKNALLDIMFRAQTQLTAWYCGLINNSGFSALAAADTMASHSGWAEWTSYDQADRVQWSPGAAAGGAITNSTAMTFDINASGTLYGAFFASNNTKGGTSGTLWATGAFNTIKPVSSGDQVKLTYTVSC